MCRASGYTLSGNGIEKVLRQVPAFIPMHELSSRLSDEWSQSQDGDAVGKGKTSSQVKWLGNLHTVRMDGPKAPRAKRDKSWVCLARALIDCLDCVRRRLIPPRTSLACLAFALQSSGFEILTPLHFHSSHLRPETHYIPSRLCARRSRSETSIGHHFCTVFRYVLRRMRLLVATLHS